LANILPGSASNLQFTLNAPFNPDVVADQQLAGRKLKNGDAAMFQTNPPEFDSTREDPSSRKADADADRLGKPNPEKSADSNPEFATLEAFAAWMDIQLATLETAHEGFETVSSVRGFYGR
jgi:hypothetical protein